jgi:hypothetical protein
MLRRLFDRYLENTVQHAFLKDTKFASWTVFFDIETRTGADHPLPSQLEILGSVYRAPLRLEMMKRLEVLRFLRVLKPLAS